MTTMPTIHPNDPVYQGKTIRNNEAIAEPCCDDNNEDCMMVGTYLFIKGGFLTDDSVDFSLDDFRMVAFIEGYEPVISDEAKKDCIVELLKSKHGRNINFL